jgi:hypothetical protein
MSLSTISSPRTDYTKRIKDVMGRLKIAKHQNIYDADFEYGKQSLRWEEITANGGAISHLAGAGGCAMYLPASTASVASQSALTIRQSRPYHRYQPGKSMFMATAVNFSIPTSNQYQRVGFFDDNNGIFFEQGPATTGNPAGMRVVVRNDTNYFPNGSASPTAVRDSKVDFTMWSDPQGIKNEINWNLIQMLWIEYAWYGAGCLRWGVLLNGEQYILHEIGTGNNSSYGGGIVGSATTTATFTSGATSMTVASATSINTGMLITGTNIAPGTYVMAINGTTISLSLPTTGSGSGITINFSTSGMAPWARTGNLPVRYEQRDSGIGAGPTTMYHYGVSVIIEGEYDNQRGFTYSYGMDRAIPRRYISPNATRFPVLSIQARNMGTQDFSHVGGPAVGQAAITSATVSSLSVAAGVGYQLPRIRSISPNTPATGTATITFVKEHNLPLTGTVNFNGSVLTSNPYTFTTASPSSITVPSTISTGFPLGTASTSGVTWATNQWVGRGLYYLGTDNKYYMGKITGNTGNTVTFCDPQYVGDQFNTPSPIPSLNLSVAPQVGSSFSATYYANSNIINFSTAPAGLAVGNYISSVYLPQSTAIVDIINPTTFVLNNNALLSGTGLLYKDTYYIIGQINRGQLLPQELVISSNALAVIELISSATENPVILSGADFQPVSQLGSSNSFATRDVLATSIASNSGEVVYAFTSPSSEGGVQTVDLGKLFPLYNNITGTNPDILTVAVSTRATNISGAQVQSAVLVSTINNSWNCVNGTKTLFSQAVGALNGVYVGQKIQSTAFGGATATITKIYTAVTTTTIFWIFTDLTVTAASANVNVAFQTHALQFVTPHGLSVGDQVTLLGFYPNAWNGTFTVLNVFDAFDIAIGINYATPSAQLIGNTSFSVGSNVGAHIICQEAMS